MWHLSSQSSGQWKRCATLSALRCEPALLRTTTTTTPKATAPNIEGDLTEFPKPCRHSRSFGGNRLIAGLTWDFMEAPWPNDMSYDADDSIKAGLALLCGASERGRVLIRGLEIGGVVVKRG